MMNFLTGKIIVKIDRPAYLNYSRIDILPNKTILELKKEILNIYYKNRNLRHEQLELKFNNNVLSDNETITSYGIGNNDIIKLSIDYNTQEQTMIYKTFDINIERNVNLADNLIVFFNHNEINQQIYCHKYKKISELKQLISNRTGITANRIKLKYNNQELDNHAKLTYYFNIPDTNTNTTFEIFNIDQLDSISNCLTVSFNYNGRYYNQYGCSRNMRVESFKQILNSRFNININRIKIMYNDIELDDDFQLYNISRLSQSGQIVEEYDGDNLRIIGNSNINLESINTQTNTGRPNTQNRKISGRKVNLKDNCPICILPLYCVVQIEDETNNELYSFTNCTHLIHDKCYEEYCKSDNYKDKCPMCNE